MADVELVITDLATGESVGVYPLTLCTPETFELDVGSYGFTALYHKTDEILYASADIAEGVNPPLEFEFTPVPPLEYVLGIGVDKDAAYMGETFTFSGGLLQDGIPVPGILVTLFREEIEVGSATTDEEGTWIIPWVSNVSGTLSFHAEAQVEGTAAISSQKLLMSVTK